WLALPLTGSWSAFSCHNRSLLRNEKAPAHPSGGRRRDFNRPGHKGAGMFSKIPPLALSGLLAVTLAAPLAAQDKGKQPNPAATPVERTTDKAVKRHQEILAAVKKGDVDLVFLGDSITEGLGLQPLWKSRYVPLKAANLGVASDSTQHALWRI